MYTFFGLIGFSFILTIGIMMLMPMIMTQPPALSMPVDCRIGEHCFIQNYVDLDPEPNKSIDYRCGSLSYDGHNGIDFRLRDLVAMRKGVSVLAAADGEVIRLRNELPDISIRASNAPKNDGIECGNGVVLMHNGGYETQYCHLKQGSVAVKQGQQVKRGDTLGAIGLSGNTEFPHLHFMLRNKKGEIIDPFAGEMLESECDAKDYHGHFWQSSAKKQLPYIATALLNIGFSDVEPDANAMRDGQFRAKNLPDTADAIMFWVDLIGAQQGDVLLMEIAGVDNVALVSHTAPIDRHQAQLFQFVGKKRTEALWTAGAYKARLKLMRGDSVVLEHSDTLYILPSESTQEQD